MKKVNELENNVKKDRKEFLSQFAKVTAEDRKLILAWRKSYVDTDLRAKEEAFLLAVDTALAEVNYDFYMVMIFSNDRKKDFCSKGKEHAPEYIFTEANKNEETLWLACAAVNHEWDFEEVCNYDVFRATKELCVFKK